MTRAKGRKTTRRKKNEEKTKLLWTSVVDYGTAWAHIGGPTLLYCLWFLYLPFHFYDFFLLDYRERSTSFEFMNSISECSCYSWAATRKCQSSLDLDFLQVDSWSGQAGAGSYLLSKDPRPLGNYKQIVKRPEPVTRQPRRYISERRPQRSWWTRREGRRRRRWWCWG